MIRARLDEARLAIAFMTRLPVGRLDQPPPLSSAAWAIPLAGVPVGLAAGLALWAFAALPAPAAGLIAAAASALVTGALHEDGLADVADGFGGGHERARKLEIMRDSRIGSYGVLALVLAVGLKSVLLSALAAPLWPALALAVTSRALLPAAMATLPPARVDGLGREMARGTDLRAAGAALGIGALALVPLGAAGLAAGLAMIAAALAVAWLARRQIGGITGDVLGAMQLTAELAGLVALSALAAA